MRFPQWLAPVFGLTLAAMTSRTAVAQYGPPSVDPSNRVGTGLEQALGDPSSYPEVPAAGYPAPLSGGPVPGAYPPPPGPAVVPGPPAAPPGALSWPTTSPFEHSFSEHYVEDGLWFHEFNDRTRSFSFQVDYLYANFKRPDGLVGQRGAQRYIDRIDQIVLADPFELEDVPLAIIGVPQDPFSNGSGPANVFVPGGLEGTGFRYFDPIPARETGQANSSGFRLSTVIENPDYSGVIISGFATGKDTSTFNALREISGLRNGPFIDPELARAIVSSASGTLITSLDPPTADPTFDPGFSTLAFLGQNLFNLPGLPVDDGTLSVVGDRVFGGTTIPYDLQFITETTSEAAGANVAFVTTRFIDKDFFHMRGLVGAKYMFVREGFNFFGQDSGLTYDNLDPDEEIFPLVKLHSLPDFVDNDGDGIIDNAGAVEDIDSEIARFGRLDTISQTLGVYHPGAYTAFVDSRAESHLWGPEVGLNYDLGGEKFRLTGNTKIGLMVNHERIRLRGDNIGEANNIGNNIDLADLDDLDGDPIFAGDAASPFFLQDSPLLQPTADDPQPNFFEDEEQHTHFSPMFEQSLQAEVPLFGYVPLINRLEFLEEATFNFGVTYTYLGELARPAESIRWTANPRAGLFPEIELKRASWHVFSWNVGVNVPF